MALSTCTRPAVTRPAIAARCVRVAQRPSVVVKSNHRVLECALASAILLVSGPAMAFDGAQGTESTEYEREMMSLIQARTGKQELQVKAPEVAPPVAIEAPATKVEAAMTAEQRSQAIRADAIKTAQTDISRSQRAGAASFNNSSGNNGTGALLGLAAVAAVAAGAAFYYNKGSDGSSAGGVTTTAPPTEEQLAPEREQTPSPTA